MPHSVRTRHLTFHKLLKGGRGDNVGNQETGTSGRIHGLVQRVSDPSTRLQGTPLLRSREGKSRSKLPELPGPWRCSPRLRQGRLRLLLRLLLLRHQGWSRRRPLGTLGPPWTPLPPGALQQSVRENRSRFGAILTERLLKREHLGEPGTK
ncbi:unnamed protein product [Boreogadus saida]